MAAIREQAPRELGGDPFFSTDLFTETFPPYSDAWFAKRTPTTRRRSAVRGEKPFDIEIPLIHNPEDMRRPFDATEGSIGLSPGVFARDLYGNVGRAFRSFDKVNLTKDEDKRVFVTAAADLYARGQTTTGIPEDQYYKELAKGLLDEAQKAKSDKEGNGIVLLLAALPFNTLISDLDSLTKARELHEDYDESEARDVMERARRLIAACHEKAFGVISASVGLSVGESELDKVDIFLRFNELYPALARARQQAAELYFSSTPQLDPRRWQDQMDFAILLLGNDDPRWIENVHNFISGEFLPALPGNRDRFIAYLQQVVDTMPLAGPKNKQAPWEELVSIFRSKEMPPDVALSLLSGKLETVTQAENFVNPDQLEYILTGLHDILVGLKYDNEKPEKPKLEMAQAKELAKTFFRAYVWASGYFSYEQMKIGMTTAISELLDDIASCYYSNGEIWKVFRDDPEVLAEAMKAFILAHSTVLVGGHDHTAATNMYYLWAECCGRPEPPKGFFVEGLIFEESGN